MSDLGKQIDVVRVVEFPDGRLDSRNASAYVGLSEKTLAMMRCKGKGPKFIKRGRVFYYREDLDDWLAEAQRVSSTAQARMLRARADEAT
jgi:Helix-turn-helix domain